MFGTKSLGLESCEVRSVRLDSGSKLPLGFRTHRRSHFVRIEEVSLFWGFLQGGFEVDIISERAPPGVGHHYRFLENRCKRCNMPKADFISVCERSREHLDLEHTWCGNGRDETR